MSTHSDYHLKFLRTALGKKKKKSDWVALYIVSLKRSSSQGPGRRAQKPRALQNTNSFAKIQPPNGALIHITAHYPPLEFQPDCSQQFKIPTQSPSQKFYLVWCQSQFRILFCHTFSRENFNAVSPLYKNLLFPVHTLLQKASQVVRTCSTFQTADEKPLG